MLAFMQSKQTKSYNKQTNTDFAIGRLFVEREVDDLHFEVGSNAAMVETNLSSQRFFLANLHLQK